MTSQIYYWKLAPPRWLVHATIDNTPTYELKMPVEPAAIWFMLEHLQEIMVFLPCYT